MENTSNKHQHHYNNNKNIRIEQKQKKYQLKKLVGILSSLNNIDYRLHTLVNDKVNFYDEKLFMTYKTLNDLSEFDFKNKQGNYPHRDNFKTQKPFWTKNNNQKLRVYADFETTTDINFNKYITKVHEDFTRGKSNLAKKRAYLKSNEFKKPQVYIATICFQLPKQYNQNIFTHIKKVLLTSNLKEAEKQELIDNDFFNLQHISHCESKKCKAPQLQHWRASFWNIKHFIFFLTTFLKNIELWFHNGAKFDNFYLQSGLIDNNFQPFFEYKYNQPLITQITKLQDDIEFRVNYFQKINPTIPLEHNNPKFAKFYHGQLHPLASKKEELLFLYAIWEDDYKKKEDEWQNLIDKVSNEPELIEEEQLIFVNNKSLIRQLNTLLDKERWIKNNWTKTTSLKNRFYQKNDGKNRILIQRIYCGTTYRSTNRLLSTNSPQLPNHNYINIRDNALIFTTSIKEIGKDLVRYWYPKGITDAEHWFLKKEISNNHQQQNTYKSNCEMLEHNQGTVLDYAYTDSFILMMFHNMLEESKVVKIKELKLTAGSSSVNYFYREFGENFIKNNLNNPDVIELVKINKDYKLYNLTQFCPIKQKIKTWKNLRPSQLGQQVITNLLPTYWITEKIHQDLRKWYKGAIVHANPKWQGKLIKKASKSDANSAYPNVMASEKIKCPVGIGVPWDEPDYDFKLYTLKIKKTIINFKGLPFVTDSSQNKKTNNFLKILTAGMKIRIDSNEYLRFRLYYSRNEGVDYDIEVEWSFKSVFYNDIFGTYIDKWYGLKTTTKSIPEKIFAKILLNCLYGKFATKFLMETSFIGIDNLGSKYIEPNHKKYFLPIGSSTTASARMYLVDCVHEKYEMFIYCDTDSLILTCSVKEINKFFPYIFLDNQFIGAWKIEGDNLWGIVRRAKQYHLVSLDDFKINSAFAGYRLENETRFNSDEIVTDTNQNLGITFTKLINGCIIDNQITKTVLPYGVILNETEKIIKPIWQFPKIDEQIYFREEHFYSTIEDIKEFEQMVEYNYNDNLYNLIKKNNRIKKITGNFNKIPC